MRILGAILAGGKSRRFGSDKALAMWGAQRLFDHVVDRLGAQTDGLVVCGRDWPGLLALPDRPDGKGPLAGLSAALHHAHHHGFDAVLCAPVDVHPLPDDLRERLRGTGASVLETQHAIGFWPTRFRAALDRQLGQGNYRFANWIVASGAERRPEPACELANINTTADLSRLALRHSG